MFFEIVKQAHHAWVTRLDDDRKSGQEMESAGITGVHECSLGKWSDSAGKEKYSDLPEFVAMEEAHNELHETVSRAVDCSQQEDKEDFEKALDQVNRAWDHFVASVDALEAKVTA